jgi:hypothetical protein
MKKIYTKRLFFMVCFSLPVLLHAQQEEPQVKKVQDYLKKAAGKIESSLEARPEFTNAEVPAQWKDESGVILYRYTFIEVGELAKDKKNTHYHRVYSRYRIKLNDRFAVNDFSEFSFGKDDYLEIKVIKPDGSEIEVDMSTAVSVDGRVEDFLGFSGLDYGLESYKKIPVSGLGKGDIVEVTRMSENVRYFADRIVHQPLNLQPHGFTLSGKYPVCHQIIHFNIQDPFRLSFSSLNGAPEIRTVKISKTKGFYEFHDSLRARVKGEYWSIGMGELPSVKYNITLYSKKNGDRQPDFCNPGFEVKQSVSEKELERVVHILANDRIHSGSGIYNDFITRYMWKINNDETYAEYFYYMYRAYHFSGSPGSTYGNARFINIFRRMLDKRKIPYEFLLAVPKTSGGLDHLLSVNEIIWAIRLKESGTIYSSFNAFSNPGDISYFFKGYEIYIAQPSKKLKDIVLQREEMPADRPEDNLRRHIITAYVNDDSASLRIRRTNLCSGYAKNAYTGLIPRSTFYNERSMYNLSVPDDIYPVLYEFGFRYTSAFSDEKERQKASAIKREKDKAISLLRAGLEEEGIRVKEFLSYSLTNDGRNRDEPDLAFEEAFITDNLLYKVNDVYVLDIGKLLGAQFQIKDSEDETRENNIYFAYPRAFSYDMSFHIPAGWQPADLSGLNISVENETGSYKVEASIEGEVLKVRSEKTYRGNEFSKDKWKDVLEFTHLAADINQKKLLFTINTPSK